MTSCSDDWRHGVEHRRLQELVSRRARRQPVAVVGFTWEYWLATRQFKLSEYRFSGPSGRDTRTHDVVLPGDVAPQG